MKGLLSLLVLSSFCAHAQLKPVLFQFKSDSVVQWYYHFGDEFSGRNINLDKWYPRYPWGGLLLDQSQWAVPEMVAQKQGWLVLSATEFHQKTSVPGWMINQDQAKELGLDVSKNEVYLDYLTSCVWSKESFKYGYFECRAVVPEGQGLWPAFWLFGQNGKDEIDIMECKGERPNDVHVDIHLPERKDYVPGAFGVKKDWGGWVRMKQKVAQDTVIYSGLWLPNSLTYFVNGVPVSHFDGDFSTPMNVIVNLAIARDGYAFNPGPNAQTPFPASYLVDYIRVWKLDPSAAKSMNEFPQIDVNEKGWIPVKGSSIKKKIPLIYPKKELQKENGFVSLVPVSATSYLIQVNGTETTSVSAYVDGIEHPEYITEIEHYIGKTLLGKDISIRLQEAPKNLELRIKYGAKEVSFWPFR
ncbi:MAG: hypothetical protein RLZZ301_12 [Bacteroidota bacterium]|jgi:beta-glucanase (GH16 family)